MAALSKLGRYELRQVLGKGAMGIVYEGFDPTLNRRVAIKTILKSVVADEDGAAAYSARFMREAKAVARLNHPSIVQVYDFGEQGDIAYIVMEHVNGRDLKSYFNAKKRFDPAELVQIMGELLDALEFAHNASVIHRDVKPANVMIDEWRRVKLTDFGVARIQDAADRSKSGAMVGTPAFMSPEQISGGAVDRRTDLFSAGVVLYQLLTGEQPFKGGGTWTVAKKIMQEEAPPPSTLNRMVSPQLDAVVAKALAKNVEARYQTATQFNLALKHACDGIPGTDEAEKTVAVAQSFASTVASGSASAPAGDSTVLRTQRPRAKRWLWSAVSAALALIVVVSGWLWSRREASVDRVATKAELAVIDSKSIAILPFTNMSDDKDNAYFADGIHEDLLTQLALLGDLKVVSRTSVMDYRNSTKNIRQIGAELGVASLVEGSVRRAGNRVRVTAQLIDVRADKHLWANSYDRELKDIFAIQSELATEIAKALKVTLGPNEQARLARKPTDNLAAYDLLLRHQELVSSTATKIETGYLKERIAVLSKAVELDPKFALAWARLGADHAQMHASNLDRTASRLSLAKQAIDRALALAPHDIDVRIEEGTVHYYADRDFERAAIIYEDVLRIAPNHVEALFQLAEVRSRQLRWTDTFTHLERALAVDPRNVKVLSALEGCMIHFRHFDRVLALGQKIITIRPDDIEAKGVYYLFEHLRSGSWASFDEWRSTLRPGAERLWDTVWQGDLERAFERRDWDGVLRLHASSPGDTVIDHDVKIMEAMVFLAKGDRSKAMEIARSELRKLTAERQQRPNDANSVRLAALHQAILGNREAAFSERRRAHAIALARNDLTNVNYIYDSVLTLHALLGDRERALHEFKRQVKRPGHLVHGVNAFHPELSFLRDDPEFKAIVNDPANNAPLPLGVEEVLLIEK